MNIHLRVDASNREHTRMTVFIGGQNCGRLTIGTDDAASFHQIMQMGCVRGVDEFLSTGKFYKSEDDADGET